MARYKTFFLALLLAVLCVGAQPQKNGDSGISILEQTSKAFTGIAKKAMPATVFIKAQISAAQGDGVDGPQDPFQDEFFRRFFGGNPFGPPPQAQPQLAGGSGFIIRPDGYIVTNAHVVKDGTQITVILGDGREYPATIKGLDVRTDLALIKIEEKNLPTLAFGDSDALEVGEWVVAIGNPFGFEATLTVGVVSAKGRQDLGITSYEDFIQTDAAINPGNSGGPLLNVDGQVIGVNSAIFTRSGGYMGIGLAIPSKMAEGVIEQILNGGKVTRGYLGVMLQPVDKEFADALSLNKQEGVLISEVVKDSPAQKGGLLQGDIVLTYNDKPAKSVSKFRNDVGMMSPGTSLKLQILRQNKPLTLTIILGSQPEHEAVASEVSQKIGLEVENLTPEIAAKLGYPAGVEGVVITKVKPGSSAAVAGLRSGFLITGVAVDWNQQKAVKNLSEFEEALGTMGNRKHVILIVRHQNFQRYYTLKIQ